MMTTTELAKKTGVAPATIKLWVSKGHLRPAVTGYGTGDRHMFSDDSVAQVRAIVLIREWFGDGRAAREVIEEAIPQVRTSTPRIRVREFELALTG